MTLTLTGNPVSVNRLYRGRRFLTPEGQAIKRDYYSQARMQYRGDVLTEPIVLTAHVYFKNSASDLDNAMKGLLDSLSGVLWKDDRQVVELHAYKRKDASNPRIEIEVAECVI